MLAQRAAHLSGNVGMATMADRRADAIFTQAPAGIVGHRWSGGLQCSSHMYRAKIPFPVRVCWIAPQQMLRVPDSPNRVGVKPMTQPSPLRLHVAHHAYKSVMVSAALPVGDLA